MFRNRRGPRTFAAVDRLNHMCVFCTRFAFLACIGFNTKFVWFGFEILCWPERNVCKSHNVRACVLQPLTSEDGACPESGYYHDTHQHNNNLVLVKDGFN